MKQLGAPFALGRRNKITRITTFFNMLWELVKVQQIEVTGRRQTMLHL